MSEKRKDNKGRVLRAGELQRSDGKYEYRYVDSQGVRQSVYSWRLVEADKMPAGKKYTTPLRDMEKEIQKCIDDGILSHENKRVTLNQRFDKLMLQKKRLKETTRSNYMYMYDTYVRNSFGNRTIVSIKFSDALEFYESLLTVVGLKHTTVRLIHGVVRQVFNVAVRDGIIRTNPTAGVIEELKNSHEWEKPKRHAMTKEEQSVFIDYVSKTHAYQKWYPLFVLMLGTGIRIGEALGLRWEDCDFENETISINHNLAQVKSSTENRMVHIITSPKTTAGRRVIPMLYDVKRVLLDEKKRQMVCGFNQTVIDGYQGFIFSNNAGNVISAPYINEIIYRIVDEYNKTEARDALSAGRRPILLPKISAHIFRHTFCTRFCENETDIKVIQEIMGHSSISITMDIYNECTAERKRHSFKALDGKFRIA